MTQPTEKIKPNVVIPTWNGLLVVNRLDRFDSPNGTIGLGNRLLQTGEYCRQEVETVLQILKMLRYHRNRRIIAYDLGANIGCHCIKWATEFVRDLDIVAVEAQRHVFYMLCGNIALNSLYNIEALNMAVSDKTGQMDFLEPDYTKAASFASLELDRTGVTQPIGQSLSPTKVARVNTVRLDELHDKIPDFIKLDIEGMELRVLEASEAFVAAHKPVLMCEHIKSDRERLLKFFDRIGYRHLVMGQDFIAIHIADPIWENISNQN